jgi:hypothetical protein
VVVRVSAPQRQPAHRHGGQPPGDGPAPG